MFTNAQMYANIGETTKRKNDAHKRKYEHERISLR